MDAKAINTCLKKLDKHFKAVNIGGSFLIEYGNSDLCTLFISDSPSENLVSTWNLTFNPAAFIPANKFGASLMEKLFKGLMEAKND